MEKKLLIVAVALVAILAAGIITNNTNNALADPGIVAWAPDKVNWGKCSRIGMVRWGKAPAGYRGVQINTCPPFELAGGVVCFTLKVEVHNGRWTALATYRNAKWFPAADQKIGNKTQEVARFLGSSKAGLSDIIEDYLTFLEDKTEWPMDRAKEGTNALNVHVGQKDGEVFVIKDETYTVFTEPTKPAQGTAQFVRRDP